MRMYAVALACGVLVGIIYGLLNVRSPAPPVVALIGLLGEQVVPIVKRLMVGEPITVGWIRSDSVPHIFGELPTRSASIDAIDHEVRK